MYSRTAGGIVRCSVLNQTQQISGRRRRSGGSVIGVRSKKDGSWTREWHKKEGGLGTFLVDWSQKGKNQKAKKGTAEAVSDWLTGPHPTRVVAVPDAKPLWERASVLSNFSFNFRPFAC
jgi:hypothetical protein